MVNAACDGWKNMRRWWLDQVIPGLPLSSPAARNRDNLLPTTCQSHEESGNWSADLDNKFDGLNYINDTRRSRQTTIPQIHDDDEATSMLAGHDDVCKVLLPSPTPHIWALYALPAGLSRAWPPITFGAFQAEISARFVTCIMIYL